ncbi:hypothetical protein [Devosia sp. CN2-171]|uniref:hypothetical protein n=1 Tax=Devosia sp. CN2-171 TaxID=3400909 RepID=UPI003BF79F8F
MLSKVAATSLWLLSMACASGQEVLKIGSCPSPVTIERSGLWRNAERSHEAQDLMLAAPSGGGKVSAVFVDFKSQASFSISSLASVDADQGSIDPKLFHTLAAAAKDTVSSSIRSGKTQSYLDLLNGESAAPYSMEDLVLDALYEENDKTFFWIGVAPSAQPDVMPGPQYMVYRFDLVSGCLIFVQLIFPVRRFDLHDLPLFVSDLKVE